MRMRAHPIRALPLWRERLEELRCDARNECRRCRRESKRSQAELWNLLVAVIDAVVESELC